MKKCLELYEEKEEIERDIKQANRTIDKIKRDSEKENKFLQKKSKKKAKIDEKINKEIGDLEKIMNGK